MNETEKYISDVKRGLEGIPESDKIDILTEIENHIYEAVDNKESISKVLEKLGAPQKLAKAYLQSYSLDNKPLTLTNVLKNIGFYSSIALAGIVVIPVLSMSAFLFALGAIFMVVVSLLNVIGITNVPFTVGATIVTGVWQVIIAIVVGIILFLIAYACWKGLKKYMKRISSTYHERRVK